MDLTLSFRLYSYYRFSNENHY